MTYEEKIERFEREKGLIVQLISYLEKECEYITHDDVDALEDSMPEKYALLKEIAANRKEIDSGGEEETHDAVQVENLRRELEGYWQKAFSLNEMSKSMVNNRLDEIARQLKPFFAGLKNSYNKAGEKSAAYSQRFKIGV